MSAKVRLKRISVALPETRTAVETVEPVKQGRAGWDEVPQQGLQRPVEAFVKRPGGVISAPVMIVTVSVREEVTTNRWELRSCCVQTSMKSLEVIRQSPKTGLKRNDVKQTATSVKALDPF